MKLGSASRVALSLAVTIGGIVTACRNEVPGPTLPAPVAPEVSRDAPRPQPLDPANAPAPDAGVGGPGAWAPLTSTSGFGHTERPHAGELRVAHAPADAGVSDVIDLPPVPDAAPSIIHDAGTPLR